MPPTLINGIVTQGANSIELGVLKIASPVGRGASVVAPEAVHARLPSKAPKILGGLPWLRGELERSMQQHIASEYPHAG